MGQAGTELSPSHILRCRRLVNILSDAGEAKVEVTVFDSLSKYHLWKNFGKPQLV